MGVFCYTILMKVIVDNLAVEYRDEGSGQVMLLLHGWQDSLRTFDAITEILKDKYRIVRLDMPGFGQTELPKTTWEVQDYVEFVQSFIEKLNLDVSHIIGHSFGGRVAIKGVATDVFSPKNLILINTAGFTKDKTFRNRIVAELARLIRKPMVILPSNARNKIRKKFYEKIGSDYHSAGPMREIFVKVINEDLSLCAKSIDVPTLLIWGKNDTATPLTDGKRFNELIEGSKLEVIKDAGHFVHRENPKSVAKYIEQFV